MDKIKKDTKLREAVSRREQKLPPMPADLNERVLRRLAASPQLSSKERENGRVISPRLWSRWWRLAAAVLVAVATLFTWKSFKPEKQPQLAEKTMELAPQENTPKAVEKCTVEETPTLHGGKPNAPRRKARRPTMHFDTPQPVVAEAVSKSTDTVVLTNAADSLYYYLTQLENQMGDCRDSTCLAELTGLMQADERIKDLVNKIIHKQVESAYQEEYLVDTTTRYVPL